MRPREHFAARRSSVPPGDYRGFMRLTVGVPSALIGLEPAGGHGKVWHRVLAELRRSERVVALDRSGLRSRLSTGRRPAVVLASGHEDLPASRAPMVVQVHEAGWFTPELRAQLDPAFLEFIADRTERAVRSASHVITPSSAARRDLISAYTLDPERVHAVYHGLDPVFRPGVAGGRALVARQLGGGGEPPYILYAAMLHPRKNLAAVRQAAAALAADGFPHVLAIAGRPAVDRADSGELERAASAELPGAPGRVVRFGDVGDEELAALMAGADAFCLPSLYEGFGLTALEAMACGTPVVVSDRGALPEVVGDAGLVVSPEAAAVADALRRVLSDASLARQLSERAALRAREFSWQRTAAGWLDVLRTAAGPPYTRAR
jgi:glycosyltransferase involved in cell wall biosynthesis